MALRENRKIYQDEVRFSCESAGTPGVVLCFKTAGSGINLDLTAAECDLYADPSGKKPAGVLMHEVLASTFDDTRYHRNFHQSPAPTKAGEPCYMATEAKLVTDKVTGSPTPGATAYLTADGVVTPTKSATGGLVATPPVGTFLSGKDADGYAEVHYKLPFPNA